jgi:2-polyprenyl-3-methyl-5-hydroxy-6-metoxy-1,4-benzoquinol methylase
MVRTNIPCSRELRDIYSAGYSGSAAHTDKTRFESDEVMLDGLARLLLNSGLKRGDRVLEVGAGTGRFANILSANGIDVDGVELSEHARQEAKNRYGLDFKSDLSELPRDSYDWAVSIEVLEHLLHPDAVLLALRSKLRPKGRLFLTTPRANGLAARLYRSNWREAQESSHVVLFTAFALKALLSHTGFVNIRFITFSPLGRLSTYKRPLYRVLQMMHLYGGIRLIAQTPYRC